MERPTSLTVLGILNLGFAAIGIVGMLASAAQIYGPGSAASSNPVARIMAENPSYATFQRVAMLLGLPASVVLGVAGIGLLRVKPWGRHLSIAYAIYGILMSAVGLVASYFWLFEPLMDRVADMPPGPEKAGMIGGLIGGTVGGCAGFIYPIVLLAFMFRRSVLDAFAQAESPVPVLDDEEA